MPLSRRDVLQHAALIGTAVAAGQSAFGQLSQSSSTPSSSPDSPMARNTSTDEDFTPVAVPNGWTLPFTESEGVKTFRLVAGEVDHEFAPGLRAKCWGYNGSVHGPTIEAVEGDRVRIFVTNTLPAPTSVHWHGLIVPSGMDGVSGLNQPPIAPGQTFVYEFTLRQHGTFMYHSHHDEMTQIALGMVGLFVVHPRERSGEEIDHDFALMLHEWRIDVGASRPNPNEMTDFNVLTLNGRVFPGTEPLVVKKGERVRIRLGNLGPMDHHPMHLHGYTFNLVETEGGPIPKSAQHPASTVLVPVGTTRTIEFVADYPGDWAFHCHMTHHMMNQMSHGQPNLIGVDQKALDKSVRDLVPGYMTMGQAGMGDMGSMNMQTPPNSIPMLGGTGPQGYITMGGMFTILKVRDELKPGENVGWYNAPAGSVAALATREQMDKFGVMIDGSDAPKAPQNLKPFTTPPANGVAPRTTTAGKFVCPMHADVTSDQPGECPKCGMKLVAKK